MSKISLDLKKFKHIKSDDKTATLRHKDGHELTIAKNALSPNFQKQLEALSGIAKDARTKDQANEMQDKRMAKGGEVDCYAEGKEVKPPKKTPELDPEKAAAAQKGLEQSPIETLKQGVENLSHPERWYAEGGEAEPPESISKRPKGDLPSITDVPTSVIPEYKDPNAVNPSQYPQLFRDQYENVREKEGVAGPHYPQGYLPDFTPVNSTQDQYDKIYKQDLSLGASNESANQHALDAAENKKNVDNLDAQNMMKDQKISHDDAVIENQRRLSLGLPPIPVPELPGGGEPQANPDQNRMPADQASLAPQPQAPATPKQPSNPYDPESLLKQGVKKREAGISAEAEAKGNLGEQQASALDKNIEAQHTAQTAFKSEYDRLEAERGHLMQDIKDNQIDPEKYWNNHSKIASGIGMILAGFNPTSAPNAAVNFLKFQMEQNLNGQKENLASRQSLLRANLEQFRNLKDATDMTRIMQHDIVANQLQQAAAKAQSPLAKAAALQAAGQLKMEVAPMFQQFAMRRALMNLSQNGGSAESAEKMIGMMNAMGMGEQAKFYQERLIPGVGLSSIPVPQDVRQELLAKQQFDQKAKEYVQFAKDHSKNWANLNPQDRMAVAAQGAAMGANLQSIYRNKIKGGVYKKGEQEFIQQIIPDQPASWSASFSAIPKVEQTIRDNTADISSVAKGYGIPVKQQAERAPQSQPQAQNNQSQAMEWAKANPKDPRASKILKLLGK